jgi:serine/threonine-protein kinase
LFATLCQYHLLRPAQLWEVSQILQVHSLPPKDLARELIRRDWLTPFQANRLLQGRGQELVLGQYLLLARLGEGGSARVFKARHRHLERVAAIKLVDKERAKQPGSLQRFRREVQVAASLSHPNIIHAYDADQIGGRNVLIMEYMEGAADLARLVEKNGPVPVRAACESIRQAARGLQHAHARGIIHRDIKPSNLLLSGDGAVVKILDFGLARVSSAWTVDKDGGITRARRVVGTVDYLAPEQASRPLSVDGRADLYSLGCTLYHLLTGQVPFPGGSKLGTILRHLQAERPRVERLRPDLPAAVIAIVDRLMAQCPAERYQSADELAAALSVVIEAGQGSTAGAIRTASTAA